MNELKALEKEILFQGLDYSKYKNFDFRKHGVTINYDFIKEILTNQYLTSQHFLFFMNVFSHYFDNKLVYLDPYMFSQDYMPELVTGFVLKNIGFQLFDQQKPQQIQKQEEQFKSSDKKQNNDKIEQEYLKLSQIQSSQQQQNIQKSQNLKQNQVQPNKVQQTQANTKGQKKEQQNSIKVSQNNDKKITQSAIIEKCQDEKITSDPPKSLIFQKPQSNNVQIWDNRLQQEKQTKNVEQMGDIKKISQQDDSKQIEKTQVEAEQIYKNREELLDNNYFFKNNHQLDQSKSLIRNKQQAEQENQRLEQQQARSGKLSKIFKELKSYYNFKQNPFQETGVSFIPINITNSHWICSIIFSATKTIQYCDSLNNRDIRIEEGLLQLANYPEEQIDWKFLFESPKQSNNYDCGVFCLRALYQVLRTKQPIQKNDYSQKSVSQFRKNLAKLSIITSQIDITQQQVIQILEQD